MVNDFERCARLYFNHSKFVVIDETLCQFLCDFKVFCKDKPGKEGNQYCVQFYLRLSIGASNEKPKSKYSAVIT